MIGRYTLLLLCAPLWGAPPIALQELKLNFQQMSYELHGQRVELDLLLERLNKLEARSSALSKELTSPSERRLVELEKGQKALISDLQNLKKKLDSTNSTVAKCQKKLGEIDHQITSDVKELKHSMHSMLALLGEGEEIYTVQPGDSLGQIALDHKLSTKRLKELNQLKNDTIYVGQKLKLK